MKKLFVLAFLSTTALSIGQFSAADTTQVFVASHERGTVNFRPSIGYNSQSIEVDRQPSYLSASLKDNNIVFGLEVEYVLPTNRNKLAIMIEPNYSSFKSEVDYANPGTNDGTVAIAFKQLSVPVGVRYKMFLSTDSKLFLSGVFVPSFLSDNKYAYSSNGGASYINSTSYGFGLGIGFEYKPAVLELRYNTPKGLNPNFDVDYRQVCLILRYRVFQIH